jgi:hypothetical protein
MDEKSKDSEPSSPPIISDPISLDSIPEATIIVEETIIVEKKKDSVSDAITTLMGVHPMLKILIGTVLIAIGVLEIS